MDDRTILTAALSDRYEIDREIGRGGMATVYLARDVRHEREVAIKVLHPDLGAALGADRFLAEIKTTAKLQHPHILTLLDSGSADGLLYYVMPVVSGESLRDRLTRERQLPLADALRIAREVAGALDYAHRHGVIHRDIKPENILLHDGSPIVADFGIALAVQSASGPRMTQTGLSLGTPQYMAPEQAMGERQIDTRADIYALGAVTYEMLTGDPPFTGSSVQAIVARVMTERPTAPRVLRDTIPPYVEHAVLTALEKLPADRFATAAEFAAALDGRGTAPIASPIGLPAATAARSRRALMVTAGVAAATLVLGFLGGRAWHAPIAQPLRYVQKTFDERVISNARYAPDGKTLVYSTPGKGGPELMVIRPDYPEPQRLGIGRTHLLSVSSTGELAVLTRPKRMSFAYYVGTLSRVPLGGGAPREMIDSVSDADWSPNGSQMAIVRGTGGKQRLEYPVGKMLLETSGWFSDIRISPDGKSIAFADHPLFGDNRGTIAVVNAAGRKRVVSAEFGGTLGMAWSHNGREVLFSAKHDTHQSVVFAATLDGTLREVINAPGDLIVRDVAPGGQVLVTRDVSTERVVTGSADDSVFRSAGWLDGGWRAVLSRDGRQLAISDASTESGPNYAVLLRSDTGARTARLGDGWPEQFSRDGKWVLSVVPSTPARLMLYPTGPGTEHQIPTGAIQTINHAEWMPDEQSVLICGHERQKPNRCAQQSLDGKAIRGMPGTPPHTLVANGVLVSPAGDRMLTAAGGQRLVASMRDSSTRPIPGLDSQDYIVRWTPDGRGIWVVRSGTDNLERLDALTGARSMVVPHFRVPPGGPGLWRAVLADDARTFAAVLQNAASELFVVEGAMAMKGGR